MDGDGTSDSAVELRRSTRRTTASIEREEKQKLSDFLTVTDDARHGLEVIVNDKGRGVKVGDIYCPAQILSGHFLAQSGAQGVTMSVHQFSTSLSIALNL